MAHREALAETGAFRLNITIESNPATKLHWGSTEMSSVKMRLSPILKVELKSLLRTECLISVSTLEIP